jgi:hypothetical protein
MFKLVINFAGALKPALNVHVLVTGVNCSWPIAKFIGVLATKMGQVTQGSGQQLFMGLIILRVANC